MAKPAASDNNDNKKEDERVKQLKLVAKQVAKQVQDKGVEALKRVAPFGLQMLISGVAYGSGLAIVQVLGATLRVSNATRFVAPCLGFLGVSAASAFSGHMVRHAKKQLESGKAPLEMLKAPFWAEVEVESVVLDAMLGVFLFKVGGGSFRMLMPSDLRKPGVFAFQSVPVGSGEHATPTEKAQLVAVFKRDGCHHCGTRRTPQVIGDHQPPSKLFKEMQAEAKSQASSTITALVNKLPKGKLQRLMKTVLDMDTPPARQCYFAQCSGCSQKQAVVLRHGKASPLVLHWRRMVQPGYMPAMMLAWLQYCPPLPPSFSLPLDGKGSGKPAGSGKPEGGQKKGSGLWGWAQRMEEQGATVFESLAHNAAAGSREAPAPPPSAPGAPSVALQSNPAFCFASTPGSASGASVAPQYRPRGLAGAEEEQQQQAASAMAL